VLRGQGYGTPQGSDDGMTISEGKLRIFFGGGESLFSATSFTTKLTKKAPGFERETPWQEASASPSEVWYGSCVCL
jgi:hypothetical protein